MKLDEMWSELNKKFEHNEIADISRMRDWESQVGISTDEDFIKTMEQYYAERRRSAFVMIFDKGKITRFVATEAVINKMFESAIIHEAVKNYKPIQRICVILVMGSMITAGEIEPDEFKKWL
jgi:hypothetical protein